MEGSVKVTLYSSDAIGGAARAAYRLQRAFEDNSAIDLTMIVRQKTNDDWRISEPGLSKFSRAVSKLRPSIDGLPIRLMHSSDSAPRSAAWTSTIKATEINRSDADVINLHWICSGFLSIEEIGKVTKPIVWTLHDMWSFCGAEHLASVDDGARWREGYTKDNRNAMDRGIDIDRWVWKRKRNAWKRPMHIVTPSRWLAECVRSSALMHNWDVTIVPNALDVNRFKPIDKVLARKILGLQPDIKLILFGAVRGTQLSHKGWDLLQPALAEISRHVSSVQAVIFGQGKPKDPPTLGMQLHWMGHLHDDATLALLYSASDVVVIPSRQENLPQIGTEAQACGCPVVAFNAAGLVDVVEHGLTGYLAEPYSSADLAKGVVWVLENDERHNRLSTQARQHAVSKWSSELVMTQYLDVYRNAFEYQKENKSS